MSDSEDDYMSASFTNTSNDIRPSLVKSNILKRKYELEKKSLLSNKLHKTKPLREIEEEKRNTGLDTALTSDNKGFAMLQKMGYKPGMKLGAQKNSMCSSAGLVEPIRVEVKSNRCGLGREQKIREQIQERENRKKTIKIYKEKESELLTEEFRQRMRKKVILKHLMADLNNVRKVCERLDSDAGIEIPIRPWFWFIKEKDSDDDDNDDNEDEDNETNDDLLDPEEQLGFINDYLRSKYFYCAWCGTKYNDDEDRDSNCPGPEKDDHE